MSLIKRFFSTTGLLHHLIVLLGYTGISLAFIWNVLPHWSTGSFVDPSHSVWNMWWMRWSVDHLQNPFWSDMLFYPEGVQFYVQPLNASSGLLTLPVNYLAGPIAANNTVVFLGFILTGYAGFLLVRNFTPGTIIPFLCGTLLTASPMHVMQFEIHHLNHFSIQWIPLYFLALFQLDHSVNTVRVESRDDMRRLFFKIMLATLLFVIVTLTDWYWAMICSISTIIWFITSVVHSQRCWLLLKSYVAFGVSVLFCLSPLWVGIISIQDNVPTTDIHNDPIWQGYVSAFSSDIFGLFFPSIFHPIWGDSMRNMLSMTAPGYSPSGWYIAAGWTLILSAGIGIWWNWRTHWRLLAVGFVAWALSLGPSLRVAGIDTDIPMPYLLLQQVEFLSTARKPSHFAVICVILAVVFAGMGIHQIVLRLSPHQRPPVLLGIVGLAVLELWPSSPPPIVLFEQHVLFEHLRSKPGAVADLPLEWQETGRALRNQLVHEQPIIGGYVARYPKYETYNIPLLHQIGSMELMADDIVPTSHTDLAAMQCAYPIRHVVMQKDLVTEEDMQELTAVLDLLNGTPLEPAFADESHVWYELPLFPHKCQPFVYLGDGWYDVENDKDDGNRWRWASEKNDIWVVNPFDMPIMAQISITTESFAFPRTAEIWDSEAFLAQWHAGDVPKQQEILIKLSPGTNRFQLRADAWFDERSGRDLSVPITEVIVKFQAS